jgi:hypothetical protein
VISNLLNPGCTTLDSSLSAIFNIDTRSASTAPSWATVKARVTNPIPRELAKGTFAAFASGTEWLRFDRQEDQVVERIAAVYQRLPILVARQQ